VVHQGTTVSIPNRNSVDVNFTLDEQKLHLLTGMRNFGDDTSYEWKNSQIV
jgi:hypothetical protein